MKLRLTIIFVLLSLLVFSQEEREVTKMKKVIKVTSYYEAGGLKESGKKKHQSSFRNRGGSTCVVIGHLKQGRWLEYYENGNKKRIVRYDEGMIVKVIKSWNEEGEKL